MEQIINNDNLSYTLLYHIIDGIDKICWVLTCKRLYNHLRGHIVFNYNHFINTSEDGSAKRYNEINGTGFDVNKGLRYSFYQLHGDVIRKKSHLRSFTESIDISVSHIGNIMNSKDIEMIGNKRIWYLNYNIDMYLPSRIQQELKCLRFGEIYDRAIQCEFIPDSVTRIILGHGFNSKLNLHTLENVTYLSLNDAFDQVLEEGMLPINLVELRMGNSYNQVLGNGLIGLKRLKILDLGISYNKSLPINTLPNQLRELTMGMEEKVGYRFNYRIEEEVKPEIMYGSLPNSLEYLNLLSKIKIDHSMLPLSMKRVTFMKDKQYYGYQRDSNTLHLVHTFIKNEKKPFNGKVLNDDSVRNLLLPLTITSLSFQPIFNNQFSLPSHLQSLVLENCEDIKPSHLPPTLTTLCIGSYISRGPFVFPRALTYLKMKDCKFTEFGPGDLPPSLTYLDIGDKYDAKLNNLPVSLVTLKIGNAYSEKLVLSKLVNLERLVIHHKDFARRNNSITFTILGERARSITTVPQNHEELISISSSVKFSYPEGKKKFETRYMGKNKLFFYLKERIDGGFIPIKDCIRRFDNFN